MVKVKSFSAPVHVSINTTARCNLNCSHCSGDYGPSRHEEIDQHGWERVIEYLVYSKVYTVNLTGGEPTQSPYIFDILDLLQRSNIYVTLSTNLVFPTKVLKRLVAYGDTIRNIKTSIDGYDEETNGVIRRAHHLNSGQIFETVNRNFADLKRAGVNITVTTVLHKTLVKEIDKMAEYVTRLGANNWVISPIVSIGRAQRHSSLIMPGFAEIMSPDYGRIGRSLAERGIGFSQVDFPSKERSDPYGCPACNESVMINYDGVVAPCQLALEVLPRFGFAFPNVLESDLDQIWDCSAFRKFRNAQSRGCVDCEINQQCKRCVPQSLRYFNDVLSPTPYCISAADSIGLRNRDYWEQRLRSIGLEGKGEEAVS